MNIADVPVTRRPRVAILATGDELVQPGEVPGPDQIIASNSYGLAAMLDGLGAQVHMLPIARDTAASLKQAFSLAKGSDLIITIGGASVGDHDLVAPVAAEIGMEQAFYKVAMRPGKPLMAGRMVCGTIFVAPVVCKMLGLGEQATPMRQAPLARALPANGPRAQYMRARITDGALHPDDRQDSSLLSVLASADALLVRPVDDPARRPGDMVNYIVI